jgi:hypothetical protein
LIEKVDDDSFLGATGNHFPQYSSGIRAATDHHCRDAEAPGLLDDGANRNIRFAREGRTARRQTQASPECRAPLLERSRLSAHRPERRFGARLKPDRTIPGPRLRA